jgi:hydrogenase nickel incorporation protein HypB
MTTTAPVDWPVRKEDGKENVKENDRLAARLRTEFERRGILCLNLISAPGSGKTELLARTLRTLPPGARAAVLTGDVQTDYDARRIARTGYPVTQIATGGICHLNAAMVTRALEEWDLDTLDLLFIENVGNLVCPTTVDLGEHAKVVLLSVTEGEDKPEKYPAIYRRAELALITKADLLRHVDFDVDCARERAKRVHPGLPHIVVSSRTGEGMYEWQGWISARRAAVAPVETV